MKTGELVDFNVAALKNAKPRLISRIHARIVYKNGEFKFIDESSNGSSINGEMLSGTKKRKLVEGTVIGIRGATMVFHPLVKPQQQRQPRQQPQQPTAVTERKRRTQKRVQSGSAGQFYHYDSP